LSGSSWPCGAGVLAHCRFASLGLNAPRNVLSYTVIALGGLAIASAIFVILDMDTPFGGLFSVSRQPMRDALAQLSR
jgi:hypothetical protein